MDASRPKPTKKEIAKALDVFVEWFPDVAAELQQATNREAIISHICDNTVPVLAAAKTRTQVEYAQAAVALPQVTPCVMACAVVTVDVVMFILGLWGLHVSNQERLTRAILREQGEDTLRGFARAIHNFSTAQGAKAKAEALFSLFGQIYDAGGFQIIYSIMVLKDELSWWEWVKTGIIAVAQITAWFASDCNAFVAEVALTIMSAAEQLIEDAIKAVKACS